MLVKTAGPQTQSIVAPDSSTAWALGLGPCGPCELVDPVEPRTCFHVARDCLLTPRALGPERELPGAAVPHRGPSDTGLSRPGQLADTAGYRTRLEFSGTAGLPRGPTTRARVTLECWSSTQDLGHGSEAPRVAGRHHRPRDKGPSYLGELVDPAGLCTRARVARDSWSTPRAQGHGPELPETACRPRRPSDTSPNTLESCSIPQALENGPRSHETCGRARGLSELCASLLGELVNPAGHQAQA